MKLHFRTIWISDTHLGSKGCKAEYLRDFLANTESDTLYLVGDIIDFWKFKNGVYWPPLHSDIAQRVMAKAKAGTRVVYIPGNHDDILRQHIGTCFNGIEIQKIAIHTTAQGKKLLLLHGDEFDHLACQNKLLRYLGGEAYELLVALNRWLNAARDQLGNNYWSVAHYLKYKVKNATDYIDNFKDILSLQAQQQKVDGVICGHIHHAELNPMEFGKTYGNCGDWVESCTALVEDTAGNLKLIRWLEESRELLDNLTQTLPTQPKSGRTYNPA